MNESFSLCVNGKKLIHQIISEKISTSFQPLQWLQQQKLYPKFYWKGKDQKQLAGVGSILSFDFVPCFEKENTSPARFWGGRSFFFDRVPKDNLWSSFPREIYFLPKYEVFEKNGEWFSRIHSLKNSSDESFPFFQSSFQTSQFFEHIEHVPNKEDWYELMQMTLQEIQKDHFKKVVLARRSTQKTSSIIHGYELLSQKQIDGNIHFAFQFKENEVFFGITPERLFRRVHNMIFTEAIAGTRKRGKTEEEDIHLENELLHCSKEKKEFQFVKDSIFSSLNPFCENLAFGESDGVLKTPNVQHLYHSFSAQLKKNISDKQILSVLHPTAAMGGTPKKDALEFLYENEPFERGWYASPIGYVGQNESEFAVGIRSGFIKKNTLNLFAGVGIVDKSLPEQEWEELEQKIALWRQKCKVEA